MPKSIRTVTIDTELLTEWSMTQPRGSFSPFINECVKIHLQHERGNGTGELQKEIDNLQQEKTIILTRESQLLQKQKLMADKKAQEKLEINAEIERLFKNNYQWIEDYYLQWYENLEPDQRDNYNDEWTSYLNVNKIGRNDCTKIKYYWITYGHKIKEKIFGTQQ